jgi:hypothetical protein
MPPQAISAATCHVTPLATAPNRRKHGSRAGPKWVLQLRTPGLLATPHITTLPRTSRLICKPTGRAVYPIRFCPAWSPEQAFHKPTRYRPCVVDHAYPLAGQVKFDGFAGSPATVPATSQWRRMRDSNPRGLAPNPLSKSALAGSGALADVLQAWLEGR